MFPEIISHRGGALLWPENSLAAFRGSIALSAADRADGGAGLAMLECDVHLSADGVPVVIHDATLDRTAEASGPVAALDAAALGRVRLRGAGGEGVPTLAALLALVAASPLRLQVEIKSAADGMPPPALLPRTLAALDAAGLRGRTGIIAFDAPTAMAAQEAGGLDHVAWLLGGDALRRLGHAGAAASAGGRGLRMVEARLDAIDAEAALLWRRAGIALACWGANDEAGLRRAAALQLFAAATDEPRLALRLRRALAGNP